MRARDGWQWLRPIGRALAIGAVGGVLAGCPAPQDRPGSSVMAKPDATKPRSAPVTVVVSRQEFAGKRLRDVTPAYAKQLEADSAERIRVRTKEILAGRGYVGPEPTIRSESKVVTVGAQRLAYIEMELDGRSRALEVVGVRDKALHRVFCFRDSLEPIEAGAGACGAKVAEVFGGKTAKP